jgi:hypothetical protein
VWLLVVTDLTSSDCTVNYRRVLSSGKKQRKNLHLSRNYEITTSGSCSAPAHIIMCLRPSVFQKRHKRPYRGCVFHPAYQPCFSAAGLNEIFEVLSAVVMKAAFFWDMPPCSPCVARSSHLLNAVSLLG